MLCVGSDKYLIWETQYLYWETLTTNEYHTQPQVRAAETARDAEQTIKVPVAHATKCVCNVGTCVSSSAVAFNVANGEFFLQFDSAPILGSGEFFSS